MSERILNITNGDSTVELMQLAQIPGDYLPWRDVLHQGPVPAELSLEPLSAIRAEYIASQGWGDTTEIHAGFQERDRILQSSASYDTVILWFEHDLYDQLQILQLLDWFHHHPLKGTELLIICSDQYLGMLSPEQLKELNTSKKPLSQSQLQLGQQAWHAFRADTPEPWYNLLSKDTTELPFLHGSIQRLLEEYPDSRTGLSRTATQALQVIGDGEQRAHKIFRQNQKLEERIFMGDWSFWAILHTLYDAELPLIESSANTEFSCPPNEQSRLNITKTGKAVLAGKLNWLDIQAVDYWLGGTHISQHQPWCWSSDRLTIVKKNS